MTDRHDMAHHAAMRERRRLYAERPRSEREEAYRVRAGLIASLQACECSYPIVRAPTTSEHEEWCTAHLWHVAKARVA